jgi:Fe-S-cluster-containing hydrogenase component 2
MPAKVNEELCAECGKCVKACPIDATTLRAAKAGPAEKADPLGRPEGASRPHVHGQRRHNAGVAERIWAHLFGRRGHVHRAH